MSAIDRANYVHVSDFCFVCRVSAGSSPPPETWTNWAGSPRTYFLHSCPDCSEKLMSREGLPPIGEEPASAPVGQVLTREELVEMFRETFKRDEAAKQDGFEQVSWVNGYATCAVSVRDALLAKFGAAPQATFYLSLDCDGLGAQAQVWRNDANGDKTLLAAVGHETRDGGTVGSAFDPYSEGESAEDVFGAAPQVRECQFEHTRLAYSAEVYGADVAPWIVNFCYSCGAALETGE